MDTGMKNLPDPAKQNRMIMGGVAVAAVLGYLWYKRNSDVQNLGDAVSGGGEAPCRQVRRQHELREPSL